MASFPKELQTDIQMVQKINYRTVFHLHLITMQYPNKDPRKLFIISSVNSSSSLKVQWFLSVQTVHFIQWELLAAQPSFDDV